VSDRSRGAGQGSTGRSAWPRSSPPSRSRAGFIFKAGPAGGLRPGSDAAVGPDRPWLTAVVVRGWGGSSHTAVRSGVTIQGSYTQPWTREAHWYEEFSHISGTIGASCMIRWSIWPHMAARRPRSGSARARSISRFTSGLWYSL
jgi:hypothetical protein